MTSTILSTLFFNSIFGQAFEELRFVSLESSSTSIMLSSSTGDCDSETSKDIRKFHSPVPEQSISSYDMLSTLLICCLLKFRLASLLLNPSCFVSSCLVLSCLVLSCLVLSCLVLSCLVLSYFVLFCLALSCLVLFCLVLSCFVIVCLFAFCYP